MCLGPKCERKIYALGMCKRHYTHEALGKPLVELFDVSTHCAKGHCLLSQKPIVVNGRVTRRCRQCYSAIARKYHQANPEKVNALTRKWRANNREKWLAIARMARHVRRIRAVARLGSWTLAQWEALKASFNNRCLKCGLSEAQLAVLSRRLSPDHVRPLAKEGTNDLSNIQPLCHGKGGCNNRKHTKWIDYRGGFALEIV
jgi:hypothetical protein